MTNAKTVSLVFAILVPVFIAGCVLEPAGPLQDEQVYPPVKTEEPLYYFDHTSIDIQKTAAIDLELKNLNLYVDIYGNLIVLGEAENNSGTHKSDIVFTFDFFDNRGQSIFSVEQESKNRYLQRGRSLPFLHYVKQKDKYIEIAAVKIGVNYKNFHERFRGNPVVGEEKFYYQDDYLVVEGQVINLGERKIEEMLLLATFYNYMDKVVFIRECYMPKNELAPRASQPFELKILLDQYLPEFTGYSLSVFFRDAISLEP
ncbi:MAG: hypothetical protein ACQEP5_03195 [Actinomycetota bacterium]